jgi:hypothetical protein
MELRWRFWVPNQFNVYGSVFRAQPTTKAKQEADAKALELKAQQELAAAERKAKQEADAKAVALATAKKRTTITCVKGKLTKKVTAVKPKCPAGYKKK